MFLTSQKNLLYKAIQQQGLNLRNFNLTETPKAEDEWEGLKLTHTPTNFYFRLAVRQAGINQNNRPLPGLNIYCTPNREVFVPTEGEQNTHVGIKDWPTAVAVLSNWLAWVKQEVEEPDLWTSLENTPDLFAEDASLTDEQFTPLEIKQLEERLEEVEQHIRALNLPIEAEKAINQAIQDVPNKAKRLTIKELAEVVFSAVVKEGFKWGLTVEHLQSIWAGCKYLFFITKNLPN